MKMLLYTLAFIYLANTCVTGLVLKPNCTLQTFSCLCGQSSRFGTTGLGKVSVSSCVTNGSHSKDVCSSEAARAKCHEIQGLLQDLARFFAQLLPFFLFSIFLKSWTNPAGLVVGSKLQLGSIRSSAPGFVSWSLTILTFRETCLQKKIVPWTGGGGGYSLIRA